MDSAADRLFAEPGLDWHRVSPRLVTERRLPLVGVAVVGLLMLLVNLRLGGSDAWPLALLGTVLVAAAAVAWFVVVPRTVGSWRYAERDQDLLVSHGRLRRRLTVVPYGRMQVIEVTANPVSGRLGIATVTLVTASATTDAHIPGLPVDIAHQLRDRLAAQGEALTAGL